MTSRLETLEHILNSLQDKMCSQIDRHVVSKEEVADWLITPDMDDEDRSVREMDELSIYSDSDQIEGFSSRCRALSNIVDVLIRYC